VRTEPLAGGGDLDDADTGEDPIHDPATDDPPTDARARRRPTARTVLPWVLVVLAVAVAVVATWRWQQLVGEERQRTAVRTAAEDFAIALTNWDAADGMADTRDALRDSGTDAFAQDVEALFGGTADMAAISDLGARSEGHVDGVYVQWIGADPDAAPEQAADLPARAEVLAVVTQRITTDAGQETTDRYARILLEDQGDWLIHEVELLVDASQSATATPSGSQG